MTESVKDLKQQASQATGLDPKTIGTVQFQLGSLKRQGLLIDLDIAGVGMFARKADWAELGISEEDVRASRMSRGQKYLIPEEQIKRLRSIETSMRTTLDSLTYGVTGFRPYRWLPYTAYPTWKEKWADLSSRFYEAKNEILEHYDEYVNLLAEDFGRIADEGFDAVKGRGIDWVIFGKTAYEDRDTFRDVVVAAALAKMPSRAKIETELICDYSTALITGLADDIAASQAEAERIQEQRMIERERAAAARQEAYLNASILQEQYNHQQRMLRMEEQAREEQIQAMIEAEAEHARQHLKQIASPFEEVFTALRRQLADDASEILDSIKKNGFVRGKVAERGRGLLEFFDLMAAHDDHELRARLVQLRNQIGAVGKERAEEEPERNTTQIVNTLEEIRQLVHQAADDLTTGPNRFSMID